MQTVARPVSRAAAAAILVLAVLLTAGAPRALADVSASYPYPVFADGFETGNLSAWNSTPGNGLVAPGANAAHTGSWGVNMTNALGQFSLLAKQLSAPVTNSSTRFSVRVGAPSGFETIAQARDSGSSAHMWDLYYDTSGQQLVMFAYNATGATEIDSGPGSAPVGSWVDVEVRYDARANGGARLYVNGQTQASWNLSGDFTRTSDYGILQLWNDAQGTTQFDDVHVDSTPPAPTAPATPTGVSGSSGNASVSLTWVAPADGGSPITSYVITPYNGATALTPTVTSTAATSATVSGLTNGTAYTFTVAARNAVGTGPASAASAAITPRANATAPSAPSNLTGTPGDGSVALRWTAPNDDGGRAITSYSITPYIGTTAQTAVNTGSTETSFTLTGLTNGTAYTFRVAAVNSAGTSAQSAPTGVLTPNRTGPDTVVFADDFETGTLAKWAPQGTGSAMTTTAAAHSGGLGLDITNATGQYELASATLPAPVIDSATRFWLRPSSSSMMTIAQTRDVSRGLRMWDLLYDGSQQRLVLYAYSNTASTEIVTDASSVPLNTWSQIEVRYTATGNGQARLVINGQTQPSWGVSGNFIRDANYRTLQLWNDGTGTVRFDDVSVSAAPTPPMPPTGLTGSRGDGWVSLDWTAPVEDGGRPVTGYRITPYISGVAQTPILTGSTATTYNMSGLTNGTTYTFTVAAINSIGTGPESAPTRPLQPIAVATAPSAPTNVAGTAGDRSVALTWTEPADDGGRTISGYRVTPYINGVAQPPVATGPASQTEVVSQSGSITNEFTVMGLTNARDYTFTVAAENAAGVGQESAPSATLTPSWSGPSDVVFTDGFESGDTSAWSSHPGTGFVSVTSASAHDERAGLELTNTIGQYSLLQKNLAAPVVDSVTRFWVNMGATAGVQTVAQSRDGASSARMWELHHDATARNFRLYAYRNTGSVEIVTPQGSAPNNTWMEVEIRYAASVTGVAQIYINGQTDPSWSVSGDFSRTTNFQTLQLWNDAPGTTRFDQVYVASDPSTRPGGVTAPGAPTDVTAARGDNSATVSWTAPADDGGRPVVGYRITPTTDGVAQTPVMTGSSATTFRVEGLTNGSAYVFTVAAINSVGTGPESLSSNAVTPRADTPPDAPTSVHATPGDGAATVDWSAPADNGGQSITGYRVTPYIGDAAQSPILTHSTATSFHVDNLDNGTAYTFRVAAINVIGTGADSAPSNSAMPREPIEPDAPRNVTGTRGDAQVSLNWDAPSDDGGSPITSYRVTRYVNGSAQGTVDTGSNATRYTATGLTNGTTYTFRVAAVNAIGTGPNSSMSEAFTPIPNPPNPIQVENQQPGTTSWKFGDDKKATHHEIEGYASATSVNKGSSIDLMVSLSSSAQFTMDVYRMGWYGTGTNPNGTSCAPSCGGRLMTHIGPLNGGRQPACPVVNSSSSPDYGMIECQWTPSYRLTIPTSWTSGNYIVKLTRQDGQKLENWMTFVVRDDSSTAPIVYGLDTTTWQAYNFWGGAGNNNQGISLYGRANDVTLEDLPGSRAYTVSFNRPYTVNGSADGAGNFMVWDYPMIRWMESQGYDMTYVTSSDLEANPNVFAGHKVFVNTGHDEYYSDNMRARVMNAIGSGVNMALFSANNFYYRHVWFPDSAGNPLRRIHTDKGAQTGLATVEFKNLSPPRPENEVSGVMLGGVANSRHFLVADANSWIFAGTGLKTYSGNGTTGVVTSGANQNALPGIIGYEFDSRAASAPGLAPFVPFEPPGVTTVGHSFVPAADNGVNSWSDATLYTAPSGATVFAAGTMQWSFGVDNGVGSGFCDCDHNVANDVTRRVTKNILDRFIR